MSYGLTIDGPEVPRHNPDECIAFLQLQIEELKRERDKWREMWKDLGKRLVKMGSAARVEAMPEWRKELHRQIDEMGRFAESRICEKWCEREKPHGGNCMRSAYLR